MRARWVKVFITQPRVEGTTGPANAFTLSVDGATIGSETTSARGLVTIPWTTSIANGAQELTR